MSLSESYKTALSALIIEPTRLYQGVYAHILNDSQFAVTTTSSVQTASELIKQQSFDVIVISMELASDTSTHFCMKLRADERTAQTSIIMVLAEGDSHRTKRALVAGATEVIHRDDLNELRRFLQTTFENRGFSKNCGGEILFLDEDNAQSTETSYLLEQNGFNVTHIHKAESAQQLLFERKFDLILTSLFLDGKKTGYSLIRDIKSMKGRVAELPILALTAMGDSRRKIDLLYHGISDYIHKPYIDDELLARVSNLVKMQHLRDRVEEQQKEILKLALQDQLTRLYNRHYLMDVGPMKISEGHRHNIDTSLLVIDLDHFKAINDTHGHSKGDEVLIRVGAKLRELTRAEDVCARFGGEEFVLILSHCDTANAEHKAQEIRKSIESLKVGDLKVTCSIGVTTLPKHTRMDFQTLFDAADRAVYRAKENGRNRVEIEHFPESQS